VATDVDVTRRRFTLDEYHRMVKAGILDEDDRVDLIRGQIIQMAPIGRDHASCVARLTISTGRRYPSRPTSRSSSRSQTGRFVTIGV
jgi:Uma2 family endonuclease